MTVEVDIRPGLPGFTIVGLADAAVREARERVQAAILNSGYEFPARRITANLAPGDVPKIGPGLDLALACAVLAASGQLPARAAGEPRAVRRAGARRRRQGLPAGHAGRGPGDARRPGCPRWCSHPSARARRRWSTAWRWPASSALAARCASSAAAPPIRCPRSSRAHEAASSAVGLVGPDLSDVRGQHHAVKALIVAAAGAHNSLLSGPPGTGKTMLAQRIPSILPPLSRTEAIEVTRIHSIAGDRAGRAGQQPAVPGAAPLDHGRGPDRRRAAGMGRRDRAGAQRGAVPGRALGVRAPDARGAAPAAGGRDGWRSSGRTTPPYTRRGSCWWRPPTHARAATRGTRKDADAAKRISPGTAAG